MTFEEFLEIRDVKIKNKEHERIAKLFFLYFYSVTGDKRLLPDLIGQLISIDLSSVVTKTACLNGIYDGSIAPYEDVDLYIRFENYIRVFIYGKIPENDNVILRENEHVLFVLGDSLHGKINRDVRRYTYICNWTYN